MLAIFQSDRNRPEINAWLNIISKGLQIAAPHNFNIQILKFIVEVGFVGFQTSNNFTYILGWKCNCRQKFMNEVIGTCWKFTMISNKGTLFGKESLF